MVVSFLFLKFTNDKYEAEFVADKITEMLDKGIDPNNIAVFIGRIFSHDFLKNTCLNIQSHTKFWCSVFLIEKRN